MAWPTAHPSAAQRRLAAITLVTALGTGAACSGPQGSGPASPSPTTTGAYPASGAARSSEATGTGEPAIAEPPLDSREYRGTLDGAPTALPDQKGRPNPDPEHVEGTTGDTTIAVKPRDDARDYANLQWSVDNVASGGTVTLGPGAFFMGDGSTEPKHTLHIRHALRMQGTRASSSPNGLNDPNGPRDPSRPGPDAAGDGWGTAVQGGGATGRFSSLGGSLEGGPIRVVNVDDPGPVVLADIWFRNWTGSAVYVEASHGVELRANRLSHPVNPASGRIRFVHAVFSSGELAQGPFRATGNLVELRNPPSAGSTSGSPIPEGAGELPHDEQFLGVFFSNHSSVEIAGNAITGVDEGIEVIGNGKAPRGEPYPTGDPGGAPRTVDVRENSVQVTQVVDDTWPGRFAVLVANNAGRVTIEGNTITARGKGWALGLSGQSLRLVGNTVAFEPLAGADPPGAVMIGFPSMGAFEMGPSLVDSEISGNRFSGRVTSAGIAFFGNANASRNDLVDVGDSLASLGAEATITVAPGVHDTTFRGQLGRVVDHAPAGANRMEPT